MTRCIVHIGVHKTGSTSIQHSLRGLDDNRFLYARLGDDPNHSLAMHSLFASQPEFHELHRRNGADAATVSKYADSMRADFERAVAAAHGRTLIISGEDISSLPRDALVRLRDDFQKCFDDMSVVGYVRAPAGLMCSTFQHRIKAGLLDSFDLERQYRPYERTFHKFDEVFGRDRINLWKFDIGCFPDRCAVRDFCMRLGIDLPPGRIVRLNESLPRQIVGLLYTYRKFGPNGASTVMGPERKKLLSRLTEIGSDPFRISADVIKPILERQSADIGWMEERFGQSLHEEIGEHRMGDVRDEGDLLRPDPQVIGKLLVLLGNEAPSGIKGETPEEVAQLVHVLRGARIEQWEGSQSIYRYLSKKFSKLREYLVSQTTAARAGAAKKNPERF